MSRTNRENLYKKQPFPITELGYDVQLIEASLYKNGIFVAQHGSWNRPAGKVGYRVLFLKTNDGLVESSEVFIDGWLEEETSWGAPAAPLVLRDGSMLISDDRSNQIFKVIYKN